MLKIFVSTFVTLTYLIGCHGYRILLIPLPITSHTLSFHGIGRELEVQGHEVHMILEKNYKIPKTFAENTSVVYHVYGLDGKEIIDINIDEENIQFTKEVMIRDLDLGFVINKAKSYNKLISRDVLMNSDEMFERLEKLKFDAIVVDALSFMKFNVLIAHRFKVPLILYSNTHDPWIVRTPWLPSVYSPTFDQVQKAQSFGERLTNTLMYFLLMITPINPPLDASIVEKYRKYGYFNDEDDIIKNTSLYLWPEDSVLEDIPPVTANFVLVGGLTVDFKSSPDISKEYKDFMEVPDSKGTIIVSFGSLVLSYPEKIARMFAEAFARLPEYRFIWRFKNDHSLKLSSNIKTTNWLPQQELLSHPSVELFITHSGSNGQFEAIYHGVPILAIPLIGDQHSNAKKAVNRGYGEKISLPSATIESLVESVRKITNDPAYKQKTTKASKILRSRNETPAQRAAYWIIHIVKFGGEHLRPAGNDLHLFQYLCLDVLLFLQLCVVIFVVIAALVLRKFLEMLGLERARKYKQS